ncbi:hypothetical protein HPB49_005514 [Dermacentor silvarum]|uniref:Uncharacterized protein n=1 Tax=Dermacentor silvarum TaxID=543639 RepID=A0ACB8DV99_DERSI|nr:hypothetical protein HPB49_005514 [Dermacentor silvarum]
MGRGFHTTTNFNLALPPSVLGRGLPNESSQANLANTRDATKILVQYMTTGDFSFALIADPYTCNHKIPNVPRSFIAFHAPEHPRVLARAPSFDNLPLYVSQLVVAISCELAGFILGGYLNAKHALWGSETGDLRGTQLVQFAYANDLHILNHSSSIPTFETPYARSWIDVTLAGYRWLISEEETPSDHRYIEFALFAATLIPERRLTNFARAQILETLRGHRWFDNICHCSFSSALMLDIALERFYYIYNDLFKKHLRKVNSCNGGMGVGGYTADSPAC